MQNSLNNLTRHAIEQMESRSIPELVVDFIESYGGSKKSRDGGRKCALTKASRRLIRRDLGKSALKELSKYRTVYAVTCNDKIVTVARSRSPIMDRSKFY
ncbi:MAG: hypothetical protein Q8J78_09970 [Moraxellaceae bacterium]|nr:hypothetical protein [Moraxellaceae bacterium]